MDFEDGPDRRRRSGTLQRMRRSEKVTRARRRAVARSSGGRRRLTSLATSMVSWVMFVVMTAVEGPP